MGRGEPREFFGRWACPGDSTTVEQVGEVATGSGDREMGVLTSGAADNSVSDIGSRTWLTDIEKAHPHRHGWALLCSVDVGNTPDLRAYGSGPISPRIPPPPQAGCYSATIGMETLTGRPFRSKTDSYLVPRTEKARSEIRETVGIEAHSRNKRIRLRP